MAESRSVQQDGQLTKTEYGTPQGGVISPLLANIFLHVVFDKWMEKHQEETPFERYADDIIVHCKTEKQSKYMLRQIAQRFKACKLEVHAEKTRIVNLRGKAAKSYPKGYDFLGFTIRLCIRKIEGVFRRRISTFVSKKSKEKHTAKVPATGDTQTEKAVGISSRSDQSHHPGHYQLLP